MNSIGGLIFLLIMVAQGVAAIVAGIKKRQAEAEKARGGLTDASEKNRFATTESRPTDPASTTSETTGDPRRDVIARRRRQIEELRKQAKDRLEGKVARKVDQAARTTSRTRAEPVIAAQPAPQAAPPQPPVRPAMRPPSVVSGQAPPTSSNPLNWAAVDASGDVAEGASEPAFGEAYQPLLREASRTRSSMVPGLRSSLKSRRRLRELVVLKELLDPPLALRRND